MKRVIGIITILVIGGFAFSCESTPPKTADDYKNEAVQNVKIGDTVKIYFTTNSCCGYCSPSKESLDHLEFIGEETLIPYPDDCDGCNRTEALLFKAKSVGTDTISGKVISRGQECVDTFEDFDSFVVHIR